MKKPKLTRQRWLALARKPNLHKQISKDQSQYEFSEVTRFFASCEEVTWNVAVAMVHIVYAMMPTMLRPIGLWDKPDQLALVEALRAAKAGVPLTETDLALVQKFANGSIVGASKLLHMLRPDVYAIFDSRVAGVFLWKGATQSAYGRSSRYFQYLETLRGWLDDQEVKKRCSVIRALNAALEEATHLRLVELVIFREGKRLAEIKAKQDKRRRDAKRVGN